MIPRTAAIGASVVLALAPLGASAQPFPPPPAPGQPPPPQPPGPAQPFPPAQPPPAQPFPPAQPPPAQPPPAQPPPQPPWTQPAPQPPPQQPSGPWGQPAQPPPFSWATPVPPAGAEGEGETTKGVRNDLPLGRRGAVALDTASTTHASGDLSAISIDLVTNMPVAKTTFFDVRLPFGWGTNRRSSDAVVGNIMVGAHHVFRQRSVWWILGGGLGVPLLSGRSQDEPGYESLAVPRALWNLHEVSADVLPIDLSGGVEAHFGDVLLRFELEPVFYAPIGRNDEPEFAIQHAGELQFGHAIGGGLRVQGVALPTFEHTRMASITERDLYQLAMEPFFVIERRLGFLRLGLMLPLDSFLGPPFAASGGGGGWGLRLSTGIRIE